MRCIGEGVSLEEQQNSSWKRVSLWLNKQSTEREEAAWAISWSENNGKKTSGEKWAGESARDSH